MRTLILWFAVRMYANVIHFRCWPLLGKDIQCEKRERPSGIKENKGCWNYNYCGLMTITNTISKAINAAFNDWNC